MKNNDTIIKQKSQPQKKLIKNILLSIFFLIISVVGGFLISFYGTGESFIEKELITALITLFGFGLTSTVFIYQTLQNRNSEKIEKIINSLIKTLLLTFGLIIISFIFDFLASVNVYQILMNTFKYASLIYAFICQLDILISFAIIIKNR